MTYDPLDADGDGTIESDTNNNLTHTKELSHDTQQGKPQSVFASASKGFPVALATGGGVYTADPRNFATDEQATQDCVDWVVNNHDAGVIFQPHKNPDGSRFEIANMVSTPDDDPTPVSIRGVGAGAKQEGGDGRRDCTITNGDPMFHLSGKPEQSDGSNEPGDDQAAVYVSNIQARGNDGDCGAVRIREGGHSITESKLEAFGGNIIEITGRSFNGFISNCDIGGADNTTVGILFSDDALGQSGSDWDIHDCTLVGTYKNGIETTNPSSTNWNRTRVSGTHVEGTDGTNGKAGLKWENAGKLYVDGGSFSFNSANGAHGIYINDANASLRPGACRSNDGDGIRKEGSSDIKIANTIDFSDTNGGDAINIQGIESGSFPASVVPRESTIEGSVTYPGAPRDSLYYPDGWLLWRQGTTTVNANSTTQIESYGQAAPALMKVEVGVESGSTSDAGVTPIIGWDSATGQHGIWLKEQLGNTSVDVKWRIYRLPK